MCEGCLIADSPAKALEMCTHENEVFIIGGADIYRQMINIADTMYITLIHKSFDADTFFPEINPAKWQETERTDFKADEKNPYDYSFIKYAAAG
jgi:dihydrofolate reductase